jgi:hypothetical protein
MTLNTLTARKNSEYGQKIKQARREMITLMAKKVAREKNSQYKLRQSL